MPSRLRRFRHYGECPTSAARPHECIYDDTADDDKDAEIDRRKQAELRAEAEELEDRRPE